MTRECPACHEMASSGRFCGHCGADLDASPGTWRSRLRLRVFAAVPQERTSWPLITTTLFPRLGESLRLPFRHAVFLMLAMLALFSALKLLSPVVIVTSVGMSLLFLVYLCRSGARKYISGWVLTLSAGIGIGIGVAWWYWSSDSIAREYGVPLAVSTQLAYSLRIGWFLLVVEAALIAVPALVLWLCRVRVRESLDGFVIGALGALLFSATGNITWFAPQLFAGLADNYRPWRMFEEAYLYGFIDPLTAAAGGGMVGLVLWFRPRSGLGSDARQCRLLLAVLALVGVAMYVGVYLVDEAETPRELEIVITSVLTGISLIAVRYATQVALMYEEPDPKGDQTMLCGNCGQATPDTPFCPDCGIARRALPLQLRRVPAA